MKQLKVIIATLLIAAVIGGAVWYKMHPAVPAEAAAEAKPAADEGGKVKVTHDAQGNAVINIDDDAQGDAGIVVAKPSVGTWSPEVKGYGRVLDPTPLSALLNELAADESAATASKLELARQNTLSAQNNTSARNLQAAEAAAKKDQLAIQSVRDRLALAWGKAVTGQSDLPAFVKSLADRETVLIRVDMPAGEVLAAPPVGARVVALSGKNTDANFLGQAPSVDPQIQGQAFLFLISPNALQMAPGEAATVYLKMPGEPLPGVIIPRDSVVRVEGTGWVYVQNEGAESYTRRKIALDRPVENGWFITSGVTATNYITTEGAQTLLSEELKAALSPD